MIQLRRRPGQGRAKRSTSGAQRNLSVQGSEAAERKPICVREMPRSTRKTWKVLKIHPFGMTEGTESSPMSWSRLVKTMRLATVGRA